jgi:hypothetical protein
MLAEILSVKTHGTIEFAGTLIAPLRSYVRLIHVPAFDGLKLAVDMVKLQAVFTVYLK